VLALVSDAVVWKPADLARAAGVSPGVVKGLVKAGALEPRPLPAFQPFDEPDPERTAPELSPVQKQAAEELCGKVADKCFSVTLLDGVTGAGKTFVYLEAVRQALRQDGQVLILLPEIALTEPFLEAAAQWFGALPAAWHSGMRPRQRERIWRAIADGRARLVIGARSALFLPFRKLGLIVVDEEHDQAFKQEDGVRYHARDMAIVRARLNQAPVILSSATPSIESYVNGLRGRYARVELPDRHGKARLPQIELIDMRQERPGAAAWLSEPLVEAARTTLQAGEQVLLFLNRRGYAPLTLCRACGHRLECVQCSAWLVEHRFRRELVCHQCGLTVPTPDNCPSCGEAGALVACGPGVERLAEEVLSHFPESRVAVLSSDLARGTLLKETLKEIAAGEYDIVIGTQLAAKGHHFPKLTLVGVVDADLGLANGDPRAAERTYQTLWQVSGRAGRADRAGRALIQTYLPDHALIKALAAQDRNAFYEHECRAREDAGLPPFGRLAGIVVSAPEQGLAEAHARALAQTAPGARGVAVFGPAPAPLALVRGRHRIRLLVKTERDVDIQAYLRSWFATAPQPKGGIMVSVDIDPYSFM
jgi:primosomal protein N' (replication factor Y)